MPDFLHGVEVIEVLEGPVSVLEVASAVIGVVGTATTGETGKLHLTRTLDEAKALYGTTGTLINAFKAIHDHVKNLTVLSINVGAEGTATAADVANAISIFEASLSQYSFFPKVLIAPGYSYELAVAAEMISVAGKIDAIAIVDAPSTASAEDSVTFKNNFNSQRALITHPRVQVADMGGNLHYDWLSSRLAGLVAQVDKNETESTDQTGYWCSPSNYVLQGVTGVETVFPYNPKDSDAALNYMNSQGVCSVLNFKGSGYRAFGNRSTVYPAQSDPLTFVSWRRTVDVIAESIQYFTQQFLDKPMFQRPGGNLQSTLIGRVQDSVDEFLRSRIGTALVDGRCYLTTEDNPITELSQGHVTFNLDVTPPVPMERVTHKMRVNVNGLKDAFTNLVGA